MIISHFEVSTFPEKGWATVQNILITNLSSENYYVQFRYRTSQSKLAQKLQLYSEGADWSELNTLTEGPIGQYNSNLVWTPPGETIRASFGPRSNSSWYPSDGPYLNGVRVEVRGTFDVSIPPIQDSILSRKRTQGEKPVPFLIQTTARSYDPAKGWSMDIPYSLANCGAEAMLTPEAPRTRLTEVGGLVSITAEGKKQKNVLYPILEDENLSMAALIAILSEHSNSPTSLGQVNRLLAEAKLGIKLERH